MGTTFGVTSSVTPLQQRWTYAASLINLGMTPALGIHTVKIRRHAGDSSFYGFEFIAHDTTTTSGTQAAQTVPKIQLTPQNVVS